MCVVVVNILKIKATCSILSVLPFFLPNIPKNLIYTHILPCLWLNIFFFFCCSTTSHSNSTLLDSLTHSPPHTQYYIFFTLFAFSFVLYVEHARSSKVQVILESLVSRKKNNKSEERKIFLQQVRERKNVHWSMITH